MRAPLRPRDLVAVATVSVFALAASGTHVVASGDTLSELAARNETSVRSLVDTNGIADPDLILVGQELTVTGSSGGGGGGGGGESDNTSYVVEPGDTLARIAEKFDTTTTALATANGIDDPGLIVAGQELTIDGDRSGGAGSAASSDTAEESGPQLPGQRHTVSEGDTIAGIADRYGISRSDLVEWNGLTDGKVYATTRLLLYDPGDLGSEVQCPVPGASFFNDWGFPRSGGRSHAGIDLFAPRGTPVHAPVGGWVDIATGEIGGHQFRLRSEDGTLWFGSHLDRFGASGEVAAGEVIGYVGDTGNAQGARPHVHFEVHPGDQAVNPYPLLRASC